MVLTSKIREIYINKYSQKAIDFLDRNRDLTFSPLAKPELKDSELISHLHNIIGKTRTNIDEMEDHPNFQQGLTTVVALLLILEDISLIPASHLLRYLSAKLPKHMFYSTKQEAITGFLSRILVQFLENTDPVISMNSLYSSIGEIIAIPHIISLLREKYTYLIKNNYEIDEILKNAIYFGKGKGASSHGYDLMFLLPTGILYGSQEETFHLYIFEIKTKKSDKIKPKIFSHSKSIGKKRITIGSNAGLDIVFKLRSSTDAIIYYLNRYPQRAESIINYFSEVLSANMRLLPLQNYKALDISQVIPNFPISKIDNKFVLGSDNIVLCFPSTLLDELMKTMKPAQENWNGIDVAAHKISLNFKDETFDFIFGNYDSIDTPRKDIKTGLAKKGQYLIESNSKKRGINQIRKLLGKDNDGFFVIIRTNNNHRKLYLSGSSGSRTKAINKLVDLLLGEGSAIRINVISSLDTILLNSLEIENDPNLLLKTIDNMILNFSRYNSLIMVQENFNAIKRRRTSEITNIDDTASLFIDASKANDEFLTNPNFHNSSPIIHKHLENMINYFHHDLQSTIIEELFGDIRELLYRRLLDHLKSYRVTKEGILVQNSGDNLLLPLIEDIKYSEGVSKTFTYFKTILYKYVETGELIGVFDDIPFKNEKFFIDNIIYGYEKIDKSYLEFNSFLLAPIEEDHLNYLHLFIYGLAINRFERNARLQSEIDNENASILLNFNAINTKMILDPNSRYYGLILLGLRIMSAEFYRILAYKVNNRVKKASTITTLPDVRMPKNNHPITSFYPSRQYAIGDQEQIQITQYVSKSDEFIDFPFIIEQEGHIYLDALDAIDDLRHNTPGIKYFPEFRVIQIGEYKIKVSELPSNFRLDLSERLFSAIIHGLKGHTNRKISTTSLRIAFEMLSAMMLIHIKRK